MLAPLCLIELWWQPLLHGDSNDNAYIKDYLHWSTCALSDIVWRALCSPRSPRNLYRRRRIWMRLYVVMAWSQKILIMKISSIPCARRVVSFEDTALGCNLCCSFALFVHEHRAGCCYCRCERLALGGFSMNFHGSWFANFKFRRA